MIKFSGQAKVELKDNELTWDDVTVVSEHPKFLDAIDVNFDILDDLANFDLARKDGTYWIYFTGSASWYEVLDIEYGVVTEVSIQIDFVNSKEIK